MAPALAWSAKAFSRSLLKKDDILPRSATPAGREGCGVASCKRRRCRRRAAAAVTPCKANKGRTCPPSLPHRRPAVLTVTRHASRGPGVAGSHRQGRIHRRIYTCRCRQAEQAELSRQCQTRVSGVLGWCLCAGVSSRRGSWGIMVHLHGQWPVQQLSDSAQRRPALACA